MEVIKDIKKYMWNIGGRRSFSNLNEAKVVKFIIKAYLCNLYIMCKEWVSNNFTFHAFFIQQINKQTKIFEYFENL